LAGEIGIAIQLADGFRFVVQVHQFRDRGLHPEGHFVLLHPGLNLGVQGGRELLLIHRLDTVDDAAPPGRIDLFRVLQEEDRLALTAELDALMNARKEPGPHKLRPAPAVLPERKTT